MLNKNHVKLLLKTFDGSLHSVKIKLKCAKTKVKFDIEYFDYDGDGRSVRATMIFHKVVSMDFELNMFDNVIGAELCGFYEILSEDKKREIVEKMFQNRRREFLYAGDYCCDPNDESDMLNYRETIDQILEDLERFHLYQQQTTGGIYYILADSFEIVQKRKKK